MISFSIAQTEENLWKKLVKISDEFVIDLYIESDGKLTMQEQNCINELNLTS